ncbi:MAG: hypothetical protein Kow002_11540 [Anaerolineales bacterium]
MTSHQQDITQADHKATYQILALTGITFLVLFFYIYNNIQPPFTFDSRYYWDLAESFTRRGEFSLIHFNDIIRGYLLPFLLYLIRKTADTFHIDTVLWLSINFALFYTFFAIYIIPWSFKTLFAWKVTLPGRILFLLLLFYFWRGYFLYPLSDFPAFAFLLLGVAFFSQLRKEHANFLHPFLAGLFLSAALNIRPGYQITLFLILPLAMILSWRKWGLTKAAAQFALIIFGSSLVLVPQLKINQANFQISTPFVIAKFEDENLFISQLFWGLGIQKYETNIGDTHPHAGVIYKSPVQAEIDASLLKEKTLESYIEIICRYPFKIAGSYLKHLFNGLDIFFPTPYIKDVFANHFVFSLLNYTLWFLFVHHLSQNFGKPDISTLTSLLGLLAPVLLVLPIAVEVRFFLPLHMLAYATLAFRFDYGKLFSSFKNNKWNLIRFASAGTLWIILSFALSSTTIRTLVQ